MLGIPVLPAAENPTPTPTPIAGEQRLSDYAGRVKLDRSRVEDGCGTVEISNGTIRKLEEHGLLTISSPNDRPPAVLGRAARPTPRKEDPKRRAYWRSRVLQQASRVDRCDDEVAKLEAKIDSLEDAAFDSGAKGARQWARVDETKRQHDIARARCQRERAKLSSLVRAARKEGAQPGWFR
jgi:hypothetical protein